MTEAIQFEKAEYGSGTHCVVCQEVLQTSYFRINGQTVCQGCGEKASAEHSQLRSRGSRFLPALLFGLGAAVAGAAIYALIAALTGYEFALISILIGWMVGKAMMRGSQGAGSRKLQVAALIITYLSITTAYVPGLFLELARMDTENAETATAAAVAGAGNAGQPGQMNLTEQTEDTPLTFTGVVLALGLVLVLAAAIPFLGLGEGISGILGIVIIGVGLMQAWKETKEEPFAISGPFKVETQTTGEEAPA